MSEKPETPKELYDLMNFDRSNELKCVNALEKIIKHSFNDIDTEIVYGNGKTVKITDCWNTYMLAREVYNWVHMLHSNDLTSSFKKSTNN
jgi:predicted fused transcriptional regulator/phosphomethylpyrimidine kinase